LRLSAVILCRWWREGFVVNDRYADVSVPIACTLEARELRSRFAEISALADHALLHHEQEGRTLHLRYGLGAAAQLERLVAQERQCCASLQIDMHRTPDAVHLDITAPAEAGEFAPLLYGHFVGRAARLDCACGPSSGCSSGGRR
jgi:hypothetical protein